MDIELSEDLRHYKESLVLGLTVKQLLFSMLALGTGTGIALLLYDRIGITLSCYVATPFVVPLALTGFYNYHGLTFWQFAGKLIYFSFFNRPLVYGSTESTEGLKETYLELWQEKEKAEQQKKKELKKEGKGGNIQMVKKKAVRMVLITAGLIAVTGAAAAWYKFYR